ncbi:hypothetical protein QPK24_08350 [Paenibacillus polygoni]|uniref:Uncharacterized protein n=1 Tax=Paenibacillus polygoni TaxID=3050112 RepID=A0ABY8X578_9BACL|nr:hypothetical protein [Paenibacillus polygoni]WIV20677.1 hypothetical protein QPK24_08350 [Paenibacillus polygoni]
MKRTKYMLSLLCAVLFSFAGHTPSYAGQSSISHHNTAPASVFQVAEHTIKELSQTSEFADFINSRLQIMPLGPGTHSFLVHVYQGKEIVGYLIITAEQSSIEETKASEIKYLVTEYGVGTSSVFDPELLYSLGNLSRQEQSPVHSSRYEMEYTGGLPYWVIEKEAKTIYVDASNGDVLPDNPERLAKPLIVDDRSDSIGTSHTIQTIQLTSPLFDSSENLKWRVSNSLPITSDLMLLKELDTSKQLIFRSSDFNMWFSGPLSISGYTTWTSPGTTNVSYVRIGTDPSLVRYIPVNKLIGNGEFYENIK